VAPNFDTVRVAPNHTVAGVADEDGLWAVRIRLCASYFLFYRANSISIYLADRILSIWAVNGANMEN
jgi:hypothetical protein